MKIAFVNQPFDRVLPPNPSSIGLISFNSAVELSKSAAVALYCKADPSQVTPAGLGFSVERVSAPIDERIQSLSSNYPRWARRLRLDQAAGRHLQYVASVARALDRSNPDVVHIMNYWSWCRRFESRRRPRKIILEMQCEWLSQKDANEVREQIQSVGAIVAVSDHVGNLVRAALPEYAGPIITAYNGVDADLFVPPTVSLLEKRRTRAPRLLFVGRVSPEKGVHTLIDAFVEVVKLHPDATLDIVGGRFELPRDFLVGISTDPLVAALSRFYDGSAGPNYQRYLDEIVARAGLDGQVRFLGAIPHKQLIAAYQNADVLINPSLSESFGITVVEAMACGVPVVVTRTGGMNETVLPGETGLAVAPDNAGELAGAILSLLDNPELATRLGDNGRQRAAEHFSWAARARRLLQAYESAGA